jgi:hypothetical protein
MRPLYAFEPDQLQHRKRAARQRRKLLLYAGSVVLAAVFVLL